MVVVDGEYHTPPVAGLVRFFLALGYNPKENRGGPSPSTDRV